MGNGVTVIFGKVRTSIEPAEASGLSGPPPAAWTPQSCARSVHHHKARLTKPAHAHAPKPIFDQRFEGRDFVRRVRTFVR